MGKTEKIGDLAEEAAEAITDRRRGGLGRKLQRWAWHNAFPVLCGGIVAACATFVTDLWDDYAETKAKFVDFQLETDYKFRQTEDALRSLAAENVALRKLLEGQQVEVGVIGYKLDWHHPTFDRRAGRLDELRRIPEAIQPQSAQPDWRELAKILGERLGKQPKVDPKDLQRILDKGGPIYEQRHTPPIRPPAGGR